MPFLACALPQLFVRLCDLAHHGLHCSYICVCLHHSYLQHLPSRCLPLLSSRAHMDEPQCMRLPLGTTEWNHSYHTGNSLSALHSLQQVQAGASSPPPGADVGLHTGVTWCSAFKFCVLPTGHTQYYPVHKFRWTPLALPQMTLCQLRSLRLPRSSPLLHSWSVAFLLALPRRPSYPSPPHLWMPPRILFRTPLPLGMFLRNSRSWSSWLHLLRLALSALRVLDQSPRYFLMRLCRRLCTASQLTTTAHGVLHRVHPVQRSFGPPSFASAHCNAGSASPPNPPDIATLCSPSSASHASDGHEDTTVPCVLPQPPPGLKRYARQYASHGIPVKASPVRPRLCTSTSVTPPQQHVSTTQVGTHPVRSATTYKRSASTALPEPTVLFVQFVVQGLVFFDTADSDLMHHQYRLSVLQWNPGPTRRNPTNIIAAACEKFHAVILQEASDHVPHISDYFIGCTGNTDLAILLNKDTFEPDPMVFAFKEDSTSQGTWGIVLLIVRGLLRRPSLSGTPTVTFCHKHLGHAWFTGKRFCKSSCVFYSTLSAGVESMELRRRMRIKHQFKIRESSLDRQPKVQSSLVRETLQRIIGQTTNDCRFQIFILTKFPTPATFACWKIRFNTEVCTCSQFPTKAMHWIKEVKMVDSVDGLKSSCSVRGIRMPDSEVLDARIASALDRIIHNSHFKRRVSLEEQKAQKQQDRFLRGRQIAYLIYDQFRVTGANDSVENYTDLFTIVLRNDDIQEFDSKWDGILLSMTKIASDDILEGLYKLRIRESEKLKTVLELYDLETHQKKSWT